MEHENDMCGLSTRLQNSEHTAGVYKITDFMTSLLYVKGDSDCTQVHIVLEIVKTFGRIAELVAEVHATG